MSWRFITDYAKRRDWPLKVADRLGRGRGRLRVLDDLIGPPPAKPPRVPDLAGWESRAFSAAWVGHATTLLRLGGLTFLTDPVFSTRVGLGFGLITGGPRRLVAPALAMPSLPRIDVVLLSHAHFDHLDRPTLARLPRATKIIAARGLRDLIDDLHFARVTELSWGESTRVGDVVVTARPARHWGARTFLDTHRGYAALELQAGRQRVLYGGDSAYHTEWRDMPAVDLAILGIGAYDPYVASHATPEQALEMADHLRAANVLPMHHATFRLSHEPVGEPIERLLTATGRDERRIIIRAIGGEWTP
ncbi:MAG TPA: MBL fold metallo-hydrolase [Tepidisphaeraceae bacterium]